ncbi:MAG: hypothetical protein GVY26_16650, partial [Bacteroidetes bacterium]|nr:hypothetical protein [Bacteroidota bacterium]
MQKLLLFSLLLLCPIAGQAQITWDGGGGTSDWGTAANWNPDGVPGVGDKILLDNNVTITGVSSSFNPPAQISVAGGATVTFDMSLLVVGDGTTAEHSIVVNANSSVVFASGPVALAPPTTRQAITIESGADNASIQVNSGVGLIIQQANTGINIDNGTASFSNAGTIEITALSENGIDNSGMFENNGTINISGSSNRGIFNRTGSFENNGSITITDASSVGIRDQTGAFTNNDEITITGTTNNGIVTNGNFTNSSGGSITVEEASTDGIAISSGTLTNDGSLDVTSPIGASGGNDGISIGSAATLDNNGTVTIDGPGTSTRLVRVDGTLSNSGTMMLSGGSVNGRMLVSGSVANETGGELNVGNGRIDLNDGSLTNDGLISSSNTLAGVFLNTGSPVATNNGFFDYTNGNLFTRGNVGSSTDNGIDLNDPTET